MATVTQVPDVTMVEPPDEQKFVGTPKKVSTHVNQNEGSNLREKLAGQKSLPDGRA